MSARHDHELERDEVADLVRAGDRAVLAALLAVEDQPESEVEWGFGPAPRTPFTVNAVTVTVTVQIAPGIVKRTERRVIRSHSDHARVGGMQ